MIVEDFNLAQTLECGQCFNFEKLGPQDYVVVAFERAARIRQRLKGQNFEDVTEETDLTGESELDFGGASQSDIQNIWIPYFDLDRDYGEIKNAVVKAEPRLEEVVRKYSGVRILNQEFTETLLSFVISQNKNIPQIKKIVRSICQEYGNAYTDQNGKEIEIEGTAYKLFPDKEQLEKMTEEDFRLLKTGFRAPYLVNAVNANLNGDELKNMTFSEAKAALCSIKGVGDKVANCVLLFSLGFREAFPVDVWIKRVMEELYFGKDTPKQEIENFAKEKFGKWGGYAQQYLFMYIRGQK